MGPARIGRLVQNDGDAMVAEPTPMLTTPQTARYLGVKPQTLRKWRLVGGGPPYTRLGDSPRARAAYRMVDLDAWLAARTFVSTAAEAVARQRG